MINRKALFKCIGTGKLIYFEEISHNKLHFMMGYNKESSNVKSALTWLENNGVEETKKGDFEWYFDHYSGTLMRCWLHNKKIKE